MFVEVLNIIIGFHFYSYELSIILNSLIIVNIGLIFFPKIRRRNKLFILAPLLLIVLYGLIVWDVYSDLSGMPI
jgi:hypothetical protein